MAGLVPAIHVVLQERSQQVRSKAGRDSAMRSSGAATWMAGTSPGHDGEGTRTRSHMRSPCPLRGARGTSQLQRAVPIAVVDVRRADLDAVLDGVAHDLGRGVEAHGLAVEKGASEDRRV